MLNGIIPPEEIARVQNPFGRACGHIVNGMTKPVGLFAAAAMGTSGSVSGVFAYAAMALAFGKLIVFMDDRIDRSEKAKQTPEPPLPYWGA